MILSKDNIKGGEGCRNCSLIFYYHRQYNLSNNWYDANNQRYICPCENFEPLDNLLYLELKYAKSH